MKDLNKAIQVFHQFDYGIPATSKDAPLSKQIKFRIFCIKHGYDAEGYSDISSLENVLYEAAQKRKNVDTTMMLLLAKDLYTLEEVREELEIIRAISEGYHMLIKRTLELNNKDWAGLH